jgi:D-alanine-D-alanine ligase-like ATP-grasp enzyme
MMENLLEFIKKLQSDKRFTSFDEVATKQGIVLKILSLLEWDPFNIDEIQPEYAMGDKKVDFSLRSNDSNKAFIVVEKVAKNLKNSREQLMDFAAEEGVKIAILTNGITWWFFSPHLGDDFEDRDVLSIQINEQKPDQITQGFLEFLSKGSVVSGKAAEALENIYQAKQKAILIEEHLPKAWQEIMKEPEKWLVDIVVKVTEGLCGYKPDKETVENFLSSDVEMKLEIPTLIKPEPSSKPQEVKKSVQKSYTGKPINAFTFKGKKYMVKSWKDMLLKVCELINAEHKDNFEFLINLSTQGEDVFSKDEHRILISEKIPGTDIYVNVDLTPKDTLALCYETISVFGYKESDLSIEAE